MGEPFRVQRAEGWVFRANRMHHAHAEPVRSGGAQERAGPGI